jgi:hypothetical protein
MLDTIALTLDQHQFDVREPGRFSPSAQGLLVPPYYPLGGRGNFACVRNPTKSDAEAGRYLPRLTLNKRLVRGGFSLTLRIEFSAPKLIFGNNFDELTSRDFGRVLTALRHALHGMGIEVSEATLRAARVSAIHYSKNMAFVDFTTCATVLGELARVDLDQRLDLSRTDYRNEGHAIRYHANAFEVMFYDKLKDLKKARISEKRAIERDYAPQLGLFDDRDAFPKQLEVLRMEVRLGNRSKITSVLKRIGADPELKPTFAALFDISLAKTVLLHFWHDIRAQLTLAPASTARRPEEVLAAVAAHAKGGVRPGQLLQQVGGLLVAQAIGVRALGALMERHCSKRSWQRYKRRINAARLPEESITSVSARVDEALHRFQLLRLADFHG